MPRAAPNDGLTTKQRYFKKMSDAAPTILCACGCGGSLKSVDAYGRPATFINGHNARKYEGEESTKWAAQKRYRTNNPDKHRDYKREYYRARKLKAMELLGNKCELCGIPYNGTNAPIFEFHHRNPHEKEAGVTRMLTNKAWEQVVLEMTKCILVCANCHNQHHGGEW
jgi:hypothetical protein